ncbi:MAG: efflux RND transporter periplasmic adaptor subunit, partial [Gemmatimonadetes bacterium]|nr:efflux RND transporter periplasmic adaptor subunit [Gemmatimonadota bacterium]
MTRYSLIPLLAAGLLVACKEEKKEVRPKVPVTLGSAESRPAPYTLLANGSVEPLQSVGVNSQVSGVLQRVNFREGDEVKAGQVLFQIDARPFRAALDAAEATLAKDEAQLDNARRQSDRYATLVKDRSVTEADAEQFAANARALAATVQADKAQVEAARLNLDYATIRAPISGRTGSLLVKQGNLVRALGTAPLVVINQLRPIAVRFAVPEREFPEIQRRSGGKDLPVTVQLKDGGGKPMQGRLAFVDNAVDTLTGTVVLKGHFENADGALWPGQFVTVSLQLYVDAEATVVPSDAVQTGQVGTYVFVVDTAGKAQVQKVTVGRVSGQATIIASGLKPGDKIVVDGQSRLSPGALVDVRPAVAATPAG